MIWDLPHHRAISNALHRITTGENDRLMIWIPPRHGKSQMVTVRYTAWRMEQNPELPVIIAAYGQTLADKFSRQIRRIVRERVPLNTERTAMNDWETAAGGGLRSVGVGAGITGMGGGLIVIDDPVRGRAEADSPTYREKTWEWYTDDIYTRREPGAAIILILTRWHRDDLAGRILASEDGPNWEVVHIPAIAMEDDVIDRKPGVALWPERVSASDIATIRSVNERSYWSLYQGMPQPEGGAIILPEWWADGRNRYDSTAPASRNLVVKKGRYQFWDTAEEANESAAYTSCATFEVMPDYSVQLREVWRKRLLFPELQIALESQARRHNRDEKLNDIVIEYASSGRQLYQTTQSSSPDWLKRRIRRYTPRDSKVDRAKSASTWCANNLVQMPYPDESVPWLHEFETELYDFPQSQFADQVDAFTMGLNYLRNYLSQALHARGSHGH